MIEDEKFADTSLVGLFAGFPADEEGNSRESVAFAQQHYDQFDPDVDCLTPAIY